MITETQVVLRTQTPDVEGNWLYQDNPEKTVRIFRKVVNLGINSSLWAECTDEEKTAWEEFNKVEEPVMNP